MGEINSANIPCDNPEEPQKIHIIESTKYRERGCYSTWWYHLMPEDMVYVCDANGTLQKGKCK